MNSDKAKIYMNALLIKIASGNIQNTDRAVSKSNSKVEKTEFGLK